MPASRTPATVALLVVVAACLALRLHAAASDGLWLDEALSLHVAQQPVALATLAAHEPTPPLYYLLLCGWIRLFGDTLLSARLLSVVLATATAVLVLDLGRRHFDLATGTVAALLFATARVPIYYGHEARSYALVGLLCVASFDVLLALAARPTWRTALALAVLDAALLYAHYVAAFALAAQLGGALLLAGRSPGFLRRYLASQVLAALLFAPLALTVATRGIDQKDWLRPPTLAQAGFLVRRFAGSGTLLWLEIALVVAVAWLRRRRGLADARRAELATLALWAFAPILLAYGASFSRQMLAERYVLYAAPGLYLLVGRVLALAPLGVRVRGAIAAGLVLLSLGRALADPMRRHDWRSAVAAVRAEQERGAGVIVAPDWHFRPLAYYLDEPAFRDYARTRERLAADDVTLVEDVRAVPLDRGRYVLVLAPEVAPPAREIEAWLGAHGYATARRDDLHGLVLLVAERRTGTS